MDINKAAQEYADATYKVVDEWTKEVWNIIAKDFSAGANWHKAEVVKMIEDRLCIAENNRNASLWSRDMVMKCEYLMDELTDLLHQLKEEQE